MTKEIFTPEERRILELYRHPRSSDLGRATRLSIQYLLGAGIFTYMAIAYNSWFALVTYLTFAAFVGIRLIGARRIAGVMPKVLAKYEAIRASMSKMTICLWFDHGKAREAAEFYASVFPNSQVGPGHASAADNPSATAGEELTVEFSVLGQAFIGLNGGPNFKPNEAVSFMILTENQEDTDRYWNAIVGNGGEESQCGWCKDRWGFSWQITPRVLLDATNDPDRAAAKRAMEAMMTMKKIDIATIEAARAGAKADE
jgi:predicted 3-demethylubiquinone-9 3-methyltransferase (glyoxalase superfamily)